MHKWVMIFIILIAKSWLINAQITELSCFRDLNSYVDASTLVILDIDDTLLIPVQMLGCDEWFKHRMALHAENGHDSSSALENALAEWESVRHVTRMEIVEEGTCEIIASLQKQGIRVMGLTTQGLALTTRTRIQLLEQKIDLALTAPSSNDCYFTVGGHGVLFRNGVLSTSGRNKGLALFALCKNISMMPEKIVFVNDKESHIREIEKEAEREHIPFIGLRYAYSDDRKARFRADVADYQFSHSSFDRILSDEEALDQILCMRSVS